MSRASLVPLLLLGLLGAPRAANAGLATGLTAYYRFDGNATDASGNGNHGTASGAPVYVAGHDGQAVSLNGAGDLITLPASLWLNDFSVSFWVRTTAVAPTGSWWFQGLGMVDGEVCGAPAGGDFGIALIDGGRVIVNGLKGTATINDGAYHAVTVTRTGPNDAIFIDGVADASETIGWVGPFTGMPWIGVGNNPCDTSFNRRWFAGDIDELRFYDRVLSSAEIAQLAGTAAVPALPARDVVVLVIMLGGTGLVAVRRMALLAA